MSKDLVRVNSRVNGIERERTVLGTMELFYLRLLAHDMKETDILSFLEINAKKLNKIKRSLKSKFHTKNWEEILSVAFEYNYLKKTDFIDSVINDITLIYSEIILKDFIIINSFIITEKNNKKHYKKLEEILIEFYITCENKLSEIKNNNLGNTLTKSERKYIELRYKGIDTKAIMDALKISIEQLLALKHTIFEKLSVVNWFNTYKVAFQLGILNRSSFEASNLDSEVRNSVANISRIRSLRRMELNEKKLAIFVELTRMYLAVEYSSLLKKPVKR